MQLKNLLTPEGKFNEIIGKSGAKYVITNEILVGRWEAFERFQIEAGYGMSLLELFRAQKEVHEAFNQNKHGDAIIKNYNIMNKLAKLQDGHRNPTFMLCMLFINKEGEDISVFDEKQANNKLQDLAEYRSQDFFFLAQKLIEQSSGDLKANTPNSLPAEKKKKPS